MTRPASEIANGLPEVDKIHSSRAAEILPEGNSGVALGNGSLKGHLQLLMKTGETPKTRHAQYAVEKAVRQKSGTNAVDSDIVLYDPASRRLRLFFHPPLLRIFTNLLKSGKAVRPAHSKRRNTTIDIRPGVDTRAILDIVLNQCRFLVVMDEISLLVTGTGQAVSDGKTFPVSPSRKPADIGSLKTGIASFPGRIDHDDLDMVLVMVECPINSTRMRPVDDFPDQAAIRLDATLLCLKSAKEPARPGVNILGRWDNHEWTFALLDKRNAGKWIRTLRERFEKDEKGFLATPAETVSP